MGKKKGGSKKSDKGGKKAKVKKAGRKLSALYDLAGGKATRKNKSCPKCGPGMFMGIHKDRLVCGKCSYTEFSSKK